MNHSLTQIDPASRTALCSVCGVIRIQSKGWRDGVQRWRCSPSTNRRAEDRKKRYRAHKQDTCERCGFVPEHPRQLDVHHIDHDHSNNDPANLKTLCANCHRLQHVPSGAG